MNGRFFERTRDRYPNNFGPGANMDKNIRDVNDFCQALLATIPFGMEIVDEEGNILFLSDKMKELFGKDAVGKKCWDLYKDDKQQCPACPLKEGIKMGATDSIEVEHVLGGKTYLISHSGMVFNGKKAVLEVFQDITTRKKAEESLEEAMRMRSEFVSMVSHELRTPLAVVKESINLMLNGNVGQVNLEQKNFLKMIKRNTERLTRLINNVLDFQKIESGKEVFHIEENDLNEVVNEVHEAMVPLAGEKGIEISLELAGGIPHVKFDRDKITQVLTNLMGNAIKYTDKGSIEVSTYYDDDEIKVQVRDSGIGIKEEELPLLFRAFEQLPVGGKKRAGGTGLGLVISRDIVESHGGKIWATSKIGVGSVFNFALPRNK